MAMAFVEFEYRSLRIDYGSYIKFGEDKFSVVFTLDGNGGTERVDVSYEDHLFPRALHILPRSYYN